MAEACHHSHSIKKIHFPTSGFHLHHYPQHILFPPHLFSWPCTLKTTYAYKHNYYYGLDLLLFLTIFWYHVVGMWHLDGLAHAHVPAQFSAGDVRSVKTVKWPTLTWVTLGSNFGGGGGGDGLIYSFCSQYPCFMVCRGFSGFSGVSQRVGPILEFTHSKVTLDSGIRGNHAGGECTWGNPFLKHIIFAGKQAYWAKVILRYQAQLSRCSRWLRFSQVHFFDHQFHFMLGS